MINGQSNFVKNIVQVTVKLRLASLTLCNYWTIVCVEIFKQYNFSWILWYAFYTQKFIHNNSKSNHDYTYNTSADQQEQVESVLPIPITADAIFVHSSSKFRCAKKVKKWDKENGSMGSQGST